MSTKITEAVQGVDDNRYSTMIKANLNWEVSPADLKDSISPAELQETILKIVLGNATREDLKERFFKHN